MRRQHSAETNSFYQRREGRQWTMKSSLKHLDFDNICLLFLRVTDLSQVALDLQKEANRFRLRIKTSKARVPSRTDFVSFRWHCSSERIAGLERLLLWKGAPNTNIKLKLIHVNIVFGHGK